ncbi:MAG: DUF2065 family protein [Rhizobiales bacterium]|nr:DUF2065 family protein [Hyphomicrobiales bacterium]
MIAAAVQAIGLVLVLEGLLYALVPGHLKAFAKILPELPDATLKIWGTLAVAAGVALVWASHAFSGA